MATRSPNLSDKPKAAAWLARYPEAAKRFHLVRRALVALYTGTNHGYVDLTAYPEYWFNSAADDFSTICGQKTKTRVRFDVDGKMHQVDVVEASDMNKIDAFLKTHAVANFHPGLSAENMSTEPSEAGGFPDPETRKQIEKAAVTHVRSQLEREGHHAEAIAAKTFGTVSLAIMEGILKETHSFAKGRSRKLRNVKLSQSDGKCECCEVDYGALFAGEGRRVLQVHHRRQLSLLDIPQLTTLHDLAVVCGNCHALIHADMRVALSVEELRTRWKHLRN